MGGDGGGVADGSRLVVMKMERRWFWVLFGLVSLLVLTAVGPVMRESDQASLIDGALQIARGEGVWQEGYYNYSRQFGSYWLLAGVYQLTGLDRVGASSNAIVFAGNLVTALVFLVGLGLAGWHLGPRKWSEALPWIAVLTCPVVLLSVPLLSSNILSAGLILILAVLMARRGSWAGDLWALWWAFAAVALRADAVLVLPFLALVSTPVFEFGKAIRDRRVYAVALGAILALGLGNQVGLGTPFAPVRFFSWMTFGPYLVFGLGGVLVFWGMAIGGLLMEGVRRRSLWVIGLGLALLVPIGFYGGVLYTPRHLLTTCLVLLLSVLFPRGREFWSDVWGSVWGRGLGVLGLVVSLGLMFLGVELSSLRSGGMALGRSTWYPTADGLWPMGANGSFLWRLANSDAKPVDHNQRVWEAWLNVDAESLPAGRLYIESSGLRSFGYLRMTMLGRSADREVVSGQTVLIDGRTVLKKRIGVTGRTYGTAQDGVLDGFGRELGRAGFSRVFAVDPSATEGSERWEVLLSLRDAAEGNDYLVGKAVELEELPTSRGPHRWFYAWPTDLEGKIVGWLEEGSMRRFSETGRWIVCGGGISSEAIPAEARDLPEGVWFARSALPAFMAVGGYQK